MAKESIGFQKASMMAAEIAVNIAGQRLPAGQLYERALSPIPGFSVLFRRGWGIEADISIRFTRDTSDRHKHPKLVPEVLVTWSSTHRSVPQAMAAIALYEEVVKAAALIQCTLEGEDIVDRLEPKPKGDVATGEPATVVAKEATA